jgi:predicted DNA-binding WGR domain protein
MNAINEEIVLCSRSTGERGERNGLKKYIIRCHQRTNQDGVVSTWVNVSWGRAENHEWSYQVKSHFFEDIASAQAFCIEQMYKKMDKGYRVMRNTIEEKKIQLELDKRK